MLVGGGRRDDEVETVSMFAIPTLSDRAMESRAPVSVRIDAWRINVPNQRWLIDRVIADVGAGRGGTVFTLNLDHLSKLPNDAAFRAAYERAAYVSADGMPVVALARTEGVAIDRVTGADLVLPLARAATAAGIAIHFFGASVEVLEATVARLRRDIPDLVVAGIEAPPMGFDPTGPEARAAAERIAASGAGICFVALGAPKQEVFANAAVGWTGGVMFLGVGAAVDFLAGTRRRAPKILQKAGLEWAWRVAHEPRRLAARYVRSGAWFFGYLLRSMFGLVDHGDTVAYDVLCEPEAPAPSRVLNVVPRVHEKAR